MSKTLEINDVLISVHDGKPNANGQIYPKDCLKDFKFNNPVPVFKNLESEEMKNIVGMAHIGVDFASGEDKTAYTVIKGNMIIHDPETIKLIMGKQTPVHITARGEGKINKDNVVEEYKSVSTALSDNSVYEQNKPLSTYAKYLKEEDDENN